MLFLKDIESNLLGDFEDKIMRSNGQKKIPCNLIRVITEGYDRQKKKKISLTEQIIVPASEDESWLINQYTEALDQFYIP